MLLVRGPHLEGKNGLKAAVSCQRGQLSGNQSTRKTVLLDKSLPRSGTPRRCCRLLSTPQHESGFCNKTSCNPFAGGGPCAPFVKSTGKPRAMKRGEPVPKTASALLLGSPGSERGLKNSCHPNPLNQNLRGPDPRRRIVNAPRVVTKRSPGLEVILGELQPAGCSDT